MPTPTNALYLSRLLLNPRSRQVRSEIAQPYEMHRTLMRAFPRAKDGVDARREFGVLFRCEVDDSSGAAKVYVQSIQEPDWSFLDELDSYLRPDDDRPAHSFKDVMPAYQSLRKHQVLRFRLLANPTRRLSQRSPGPDGQPIKKWANERGKGKRVELAREGEQIDWLIRKGREREKDASGGFELVMKEVGDSRGEMHKVPRVNVCPEGKQKGRKGGAASGQQTTHLAVLFDGLLRVTDKDTFLQTLIRGIGPAKAFGFGLLSVAPCRTPPAPEATST